MCRRSEGREGSHKATGIVISTLVGVHSPYLEHRPEQRHHTSPSGTEDRRVCSPSMFLRTPMAPGRHRTPSHPPPHTPPLASTLPVGIGVERTNSVRVFVCVCVCVGGGGSKRHVYGVSV